MEQIERIEVFIKTKRGKTVCMCTVECKGCGRSCLRDVVMRDKFLDWKKTMNGRY